MAGGLEVLQLVCDQDTSLVLQQAADAPDIHTHDKRLGVDLHCLFVM